MGRIERSITMIVRPSLENDLIHITSSRTIMTQDGINIMCIFVANDVVICSNINHIFVERNRNNMPKRYGERLWKEITSIDNILLAHDNARKGKTHYNDVKMIDKNPRYYAEKIRASLLDKTFTTSDYVMQDRFEGGKERIIHVLPYYPDRIIQHALVNVIGPILIRSMIRDTFQSIPKRGNSDARRRVQKFIRKTPRNERQYALKMDVKKFYPSINNEIMKNMIERKIKCKDTLWLISDIIDSIDGLPIGNYTSQIFGNFYLASFDWWVCQNKDDLGISGYFRYCDDIVIFGRSKKHLRNVILPLCVDVLHDKFLLDVKPDWNVFDAPEKDGLDFVGLVFHDDKTRLRNSIAKNLKEKAKTVRNKTSASDTRASKKKLCDSIVSYKGWVKRSNSKSLWRTHLPDHEIEKFDGTTKSKKKNPMSGFL